MSPDPFWQCFQLNKFLRSDLHRSDTVTKAIVAAREEAATVPLREDDNDDETIHGIILDSDEGVDTSIFDVFSDYKLDLCLSAPSSPTPSTSQLPPTTPSPPASPPSSPPLLLRTFSFVSQKPATSAKKTSRTASSADLSATAPAGTRGSWPLIKYTGRGTPIDRSRRIEWGGVGISGEDVAEDGVLFSNARSTSLDSAIRPSRRSLSSEWNYLSTPSNSTYSDPASNHTPSVCEPPPELGPLQFDNLGSDEAEEWDSIMKTVLATTDVPATPEVSEDTELSPVSDSRATEEGATPFVPMDFSTMSKEQVEQLNSGLETDLGLNAALDLGLGERGGMNWFDLGLLPSSGASGRDSPSVYSSQAATPRERSPVPSEHVSEHRSTTTTKADANEVAGVVGIKLDDRPWWRKMLLRLRKVQSLITVSTHKNKM